MPREQSFEHLYPFLTLDIVQDCYELAAERNVSEVARSERGFFTRYEEASGNPGRLPPEWLIKRQGFIRRHMAQVKFNDEDLWEDTPETFPLPERPTRRHLALIMWAYSPQPTRLANWLDELEIAQKSNG